MHHLHLNWNFLRSINVPMHPRVPVILYILLQKVCAPPCYKCYYFLHTLIVCRSAYVNIFVGIYALISACTVLTFSIIKPTILFSLPPLNSVALSPSRHYSLLLLWVYQGCLSPLSSYCWPWECLCTRTAFEMPLIRQQIIDNIVSWMVWFNLCHVLCLYVVNLLLS